MTSRGLLGFINGGLCKMLRLSAHRPGHPFGLCRVPQMSLCVCSCVQVWPYVCSQVGTPVCTPMCAHTTVCTHTGSPAPGSRAGEPCPEPLSDHEKPGASKVRFCQKENIETAATCAGEDRAPSISPFTGLLSPQAQPTQRGRQGCRESPRGDQGSPWQCRGGGTHRPAAGVSDVAVGQGLIDGESEVGPADVAYHLAVPPDGLQPEHGHFPGRSNRQLGPQSPRRGNSCTLPGRGERTEPPRPRAPLLRAGLLGAHVPLTWPLRMPGLRLRADKWRENIKTRARLPCFWRQAPRIWNCHTTCFNLTALLC